MNTEGILKSYGLKTNEDGNLELIKEIIFDEAYEIVEKEEHDNKVVIFKVN
jgi:hypothetical protein